MNRILIACLCGIVAASAFTSCKKKDGIEIPTPNATPGSNKVDLMSRTWKMNYSTVAAPGILDSTTGEFITDVYTRLPDCSKDDLLTFVNIGALYSLSEGDTRCRPTDATVIESGSWAFVNNEAAISQNHYVSYKVIRPSTGLPDSVVRELVTIIAQLDSVTDTRLRMTYPISVDGETYVATSGYDVVKE